MMQSNPLDDLLVPENAVSNQETGAKEQEREKKREKHRHERNNNRLPPTGTTTGDRICHLIVTHRKIVIITTVVLVCIIIAVSSVMYCCRPYFCPDEWIGFQDDCYYFSNHERNWTSSRNYCLAKNADLTVIDNTTAVMSFLGQHKCTSDHWIGLEMKENSTGKWVNGVIFNKSFKVSGNEACAYLSDDGVATARCYTERKFICRKKKSTRWLGSLFFYINFRRIS